MPRSNLIICRASERSQHYAWLDGDALWRNWDLYVLPYRAVLPAFGHDEGVAVGRVVSGNKFTALHDFLMYDRSWYRYRNIMLADEDVFAMPGTWSRFFDLVDALPLMTMAAPALTANSVSSHGITVQRPGCSVRRVSFIEGMVPCFKPDVLDLLLPTFLADPTGCGWGIDYAWAKLLNYQGIYIVDATPVTHWRPNVHDRSYWPEANAVLERYHATDRLEQTYEVVL